MVISYSWLQSYFKKKLPTPEKLADVLTFLAFEVEGTEKKNGETIFDVKVLPDRAHYALCHRGIACDLAARLGVKIIVPKRETPKAEKLPPLSIEIENEKDCRRYIGRRVVNVSVEENKNKEIWGRLEVIGQKSINNIVDAANYAMFDMGQPLHTFDADKIRGKIVIRRARKGETIIALDERTILLDPEMLIIADSEGPLAIAGIKGGKRAAVSDKTGNLILESANFNPALIRKTSARLDFRTDASKRFENEPTPELSGIAIEEFSALIAEFCPEAEFGEVVDKYPAPQHGRIIEINPQKISQKLGIKLGAKQIVGVLARLGFATAAKKEKLVLRIPAERVDLAIPEDISEEVGRLVGYDKVPAVLPPKPAGASALSKQFYWEWKIREFLVAEGFSEIMTSSFEEKGKVVIEKPLAEDKSFLRGHLSANMETALRMNALNLPLLGLSRAHMFEIGKVFPSMREHTSLCVGVAQAKKFKGEKVNESIRTFRDNLMKFLGAPVGAACTIDDTGGIILLSRKPIGEINRVDGILELNLDVLIVALSEPREWDISMPEARSEIYSSTSSFPFIVRDIAFFVPSGTKPEDAHKLIEKEAGPLSRRVEMFDQFEKGGRLSFAFRIIFQAGDRTLTDEEANKIMEKVSAALVKKIKAEAR